MIRKQALEHMKHAGATGDRARFTRLYIENRVSLAIARAAFDEGQRLAAWIARRDAVPDR